MKSITANESATIKLKSFKFMSKKKKKQQLKQQQQKNKSCSDNKNNSNNNKKVETLKRSQH